MNHHPISLQFSLQSVPWSFKNRNLSGFIEIELTGIHFEVCYNKVTSRYIFPDDIDNAVYQLMSIIQHAACSSTPEEKYDCWQETDLHYYSYESCL